jgi:hypothetical protein
MTNARNRGDTEGAKAHEDEFNRLRGETDEIQNVLLKRLSQDHANHPETIRLRAAATEALKAGDIEEYYRLYVLMQQPR